MSEAWRPQNVIGLGVTVFVWRHAVTCVFLRGQLHVHLRLGVGGLCWDADICRCPLRQRAGSNVSKHEHVVDIGSMWEGD